MATYVPAPAGYPVYLPPAYRLYSTGAVGLATFFGGPLAGSFLIASNYRKLGEGGKSMLAILLGAAATATIIWLALNSPKGPYVASAIFLVATILIAKAAQGTAVEAHVARGGQLASNGAAFGIGIATLVLVFLAVFAYFFFGQMKRSVTIGTKDQVFYSGTATKADATALGNALKSDGYFQDRGVTVLLDKEATGITISFVVENGAWNQTGTLSGFEEIAREVAPSVGGLPVRLQLDNSNETVEKTSSVSEVTFNGKDVVFYMGNATQAQAQALGQQLQTLGVFTGQEANVFLTKHDDGTTLAFVVGDGTWNDANVVSSFESIVRNVAHSVGGLPIDMRLVNTQLVVEKDEVLR